MFAKLGSTFQPHQLDTLVLRDQIRATATAAGAVSSTRGKAYVMIGNASIRETMSQSTQMDLISQLARLASWMLV